ncbi:hypothetical protein ANAPH2_01118 [Anaplasma phagocytophilum]|nr:hypothetical protein ANAPH2_01118 [Anaplasma phagocytophilum]
MLLKRRMKSLENVTVFFLDDEQIILRLILFVALWSRYRISEFGVRYKAHAVFVDRLPRNLLLDIRV